MKIKIKYVSEIPELMKEWHWDKNQELGLDPTAITYGSARKVWWQCEKGHEWTASPNHRSTGRNCPDCAQTQRSI